MQKCSTVDPCGPQFRLLFFDDDVKHNFIWWMEKFTLKFALILRKFFFLFTAFHTFL